MNRTLLIGIDGAPFSLLDVLVAEGVMPFLGEFMKRCSRAPLLSTPNPLTPPSWTSIMTGRSPGNHGIYDFIWAEQRDSDHYFTLNNFRDIHAETVWSIASRQGMSATTLNFPLMAPPPSIDGYVVPGFVSWKYLRLNVHPRELYDELKALPNFDVKELAWDFEQEKKAEQGVPFEEYEEWVDFHIAREKQWFNIAKHLMTKKPCDLTAVLFDGWDKLLHMGYRFVDPKSLGPNPGAQELHMRKRCLEYFRELDGFIKELITLHGDDRRVFIVSDHGFGPSNFVFRCNTWLGEQGYLFWKGLDGLEGEERAKAEKLADGHFVLLDWDRTTAYARTVTSNGIFIRVAERPGQPGVPREKYKAFREELCKKLLAIKHPETGEPIITKVLLREDAFPGTFSEKAPDITLVMSDHGFISVKHKEPDVLVRPFIEGTHYPDGIFLAAGPGIKPSVSQERLSVNDVTPCLLYSMGLPIPSDLEGKVPERVFEPAFLKSRPITIGDPTVDPDAEEMSLEDSGLLKADEEEAVFKRLKALGYLE
jgi:predicted AlkP superfamily phosphohydrolase/phosphomutase